MTLGQRPLAICFVLAAFGLAAIACSSDPPAPPVSPHSVAGPDQTVAPHTTVHLDGSASSDPLNRPIAYHWSIASAPAGSTATIADPLAAKTTITPEIEGDYNILLVVSAGNEQEGSTTHVFVQSTGGGADAGTADAP
jgi:hypothetical protein